MYYVALAGKRHVATIFKDGFLRDVLNTIKCEAINGILNGLSRDMNDNEFNEAHLDGISLCLFKTFPTAIRKEPRCFIGFVQEIIQWEPSER
jgi:hypothetical protein